ncbi:Aste57867_7032 [Aphanomyces stellatus]|uniref:Aste57867_7032 protein n=1 Tax=Aphanomyces stellatus TaxID=120398 RepID=A0A485KGC0_9STRA|nr:hypothetical protein As57867_007009 [Aphanomyces stellatus]VFT83980.1 Aste57867_7032 [Aphanomyces stellatus]
MVFHTAVVSGDISGLQVALTTSPHEANDSKAVRILQTLVLESIRDDVLVLLFKRIVDDNELVVNGPPLHLAIYLGRVDMVQLFVACDAVNVNLVNEVQHTPLGLAMSLSLFDVARALLSRPDIHLNVVNEVPHGPLIVATYHVLTLGRLCTPPCGS